LQHVLAEMDANRLGRRMMILLREDLPASGPPRSEDISKHLDGDIYEFRKTPKRGRRNSLRIISLGW
jgi:hypothetical protein